MSYLRHEVTNIDQGIAYLLDCTLATVEDFAHKTSATKSELRSQMIIGQTCMDSMDKLGLSYKGTRADKAFGAGSIAAWIEKPTLEQPLAILENAGEILIFLVSSTLTTAKHMAGKRSCPKYDLIRQIGIAQAGIDWIKRFGVNCSDCIAADAIANGSAQAWVDKYAHVA